MATPEQIARLVRDPRRVLEVVGVFIVSLAKKAFDDQRAPSGEEWPKRYPNQTEDPLNLAGALDDLRQGTRIKQRRYEDRPAGIDTGMLRNSVAYELMGDELAVGSALDYARDFQEGGESEMAIDGGIRQNLAILLREKREEAANRGRGEPVEARLAAAFHVTTWRTSSPARPFIAFTQDMAPLLEEELQITAEMM